MSGDYHSKKEVAHLLVPSVGRKVIDLGGNLEKGTQFVHLAAQSQYKHPPAPTFKLIGNSMILGTNEIMAEAYTLAEKSGIGSDNVHTLIQGATEHPDSNPAPSLLSRSPSCAWVMSDS
jgi:hypothetical protein